MVSIVPIHSVITRDGSVVVMDREQHLLELLRMLQAEYLKAAQPIFDELARIQANRPVRVFVRVDDGVFLMGIPDA